MRITKHGHACVRLEHAGTTLVIDPGVFTEADAVDGVDAVLITHEHADHYSLDHLRATDAPIHTIEAVAALIRAEAPDVAERVTVVAPGETFDVGLPVRAVGELHAVIHPDFPRFTNSGYVVTLPGAGGPGAGGPGGGGGGGDLRVYHPGDALTPPGEPVDVLLTPVSAPWLKVSEALDFVREVGASRNLAIHDRIYTEVALDMVGGHMQRLLDPLGLSYARIPDGTDL